MKKIKNIFKRHTLIASFLLVFAITGVAGTVALVAATSAPVTNTFKAAGLDTDIDEPEGGTPAQKVVTITNKKESPAYIRVRITVSPEGAAEPNYKNKTEDPSGLGKALWYYNQNDGFYYYLAAVPGNGGKTSSIIDGVAVTPGYTDDFDVTVYQESCVATKAPGEIVSLQEIQDAFKAASGSETNAGN